LGVFSSSLSLGAMMDRSHSEEYGRSGIIQAMLEDLQIWKSLGYVSHWAMVVVYLGTAVI
jgi:hypothetical protein